GRRLVYAERPQPGLRGQLRRQRRPGQSCDVPDVVTGPVGTRDALHTLQIREPLVPAGEQDSHPRTGVLDALRRSWQYRNRLLPEPLLQRGTRRRRQPAVDSLWAPGVPRHRQEGRRSLVVRSERGDVDDAGSHALERRPAAAAEIGSLARTISERWSPRIGAHPRP